MLSQRAIRVKTCVNRASRSRICRRSLPVAVNGRSSLDPLRRFGSGAAFPAFTALRMAISANISGPMPSTASSNISAATCHSGR
jgi:hypothetical protein